MAAVADFLSAGPLLICLKLQLGCIASRICLAARFIEWRSVAWALWKSYPTAPCRPDALTQLAVPRLVAECKKLQVCGSLPNVGIAIYLCRFSLELIARESPYPSFAKAERIPFSSSRQSVSGFAVVKPIRKGSALAFY